MKKQAFCLSVLLLVSIGQAFGQKTLTVSSASGFPGDTVSINVNLNDGSGVGGLQFTLNYNSSVLSIVDTDGDGELNDEIARGTSLTVDHTLTVNASTPGAISVIAVGVTSMTAGAGSVIGVPFRIAGSAGAGSTPLTLINVVGSDPLGLQVAVTGNNGSVTVEVLSDNDPPNAVSDSGTTDEDQAITINVVANDTDPDGDTLSVVSVTQPANGSAQVQGTTSVRYTPNPNYNGTDSFNYTVSDGNGGNDQGQVNVTVAAVNDRPRANNDTAVSDGSQPVSVDVLGNDRDVDGDPLTITVVGPASHGSAAITGNSVTYTPGASFTDSDSFTYTISDGALEDSATVSVVGPGSNQPPVANDDAARTEIGAAVVINVVFNDSDPDGDTLSVVSVGSASHGTADVYSQTSVIYQPTAGYEGSDSFQYSVSDGLAEAVATVQVRITGEEGASALLFPASINTGDPLFEDSYIGVAILNPKFATETLSLSMLNAEGSEIDSVQLGSSLPAFGQTSFLASEVFEIGPEASTLEVQGVGSLQGFFLTGDFQRARLDGVGARIERSRRLYFPLLRENNDEVTLLYLANESPDTSTAFELLAYRADGSVLGEVTGTLSPRGSIFGTISEILGEQVSIEEGSLQIEAEAEIKGFEIVGNKNSFSALAGRPRANLRRLWAPQFFFDPQNEGTSVLRLLNTDSRSARVSLQAFDDTSGLLASRIFDIGANELWVEDLKDLFDVMPEELVTGFLRLDISGGFGASAEVLGAITYLGFHGQTSTTLPLIEEGVTEAIFPHLAQTSDGSIYTGFSILNPGEEMATVTIEAFFPQGGRSAQRILELAPGTRKIDLARSAALFGEDFEQLEGHVRIKSSSKVVIFAVFGDYEGNFMSAIEGQGPVTD